MEIIIVGCGKVGLKLIEQLALEKEHDIQQDVFNMMHDMGYYPTPAADTKKVQEAKQKYQQCMECFK